MIQHLACVMDGNRRWAKHQGVSLTNGVEQGLERAQTAVDFCLQKGITYLTLYAFSIENLKRSVIERECVFSVLVQNGVDYAERMAAKGVRVKIVGDRTLFPSHVQKTCDLIENISKDGTQLTLHMLFCYGGRQEIVAAAKEICKRVANKELSLELIDENSFKKYTWLGDVPDPDMVIRTGFAHRLSNFLIYQAAYSELYFPSCLWPDMTMQEFEKAFEYFSTCKRNFGA